MLFVTSSWGCHATPNDFNYAVAPTLSPQELTELRTVIADATGQPQVQITASAFATSHILVLERTISNTPLGQVASGGTRTPPATFHLLSDGETCLVVHVDTAIRYPVAVSCRRLH